MAATSTVTSVAFNRTALVTGATKGIGRALALELATQGCRVLACGRSKSDLESLSGEWSNPSFHRCQVLDVSNDDEVLRWKEALEREDIVPDLIVNNAGVTNDLAPLWEISKDDFAAVIQVNVLGVANVMRHFIPALVKRKQGVIVNMSSGWGRSTSSGVSAYCASKWAVEGMTKAVAQELPPPLAAIPLNPGIIDTAMLRISFGSAAAFHWKPPEWAKVAAPFILGLSRQDNGKSLTVPS